MTTMHTLNPTADPATDIDEVARLIRADGTRVCDGELDPWVDDVDHAFLRDLYRDMSLVRRVDTEGVALQRQGELGLWAPCRGQEAAQVGTARALRPDDFVFPSYRELGVGLVRGAEPADVVLSWRGEVHATYDPQRMRTAPPQIIIGAQSLHAVGYAMGIQRDRGGEIAVAYFGDGATSQGDVHEGFVWAAAYDAPLVFFCQNNQWAISVPLDRQTRVPLYQRARGYGFPGVRVDGNDVLACLAVTRWALEECRTGNGPVLVEAFTYRMDSHTTSDDATRYRLADEVELWKLKDPIERVRVHLSRRHGVEPEFFEGVDAEADALGERLRAFCRAMPQPGPERMFSEVYAAASPQVDAQRAEYLAYHASFVDEEG